MKSEHTKGRLASRPHTYEKQCISVTNLNHAQIQPPNLLTSMGLLVMLNRGNGQVPVGLPVFKIGRRVALRAVVGSTPIHSRLLFNPHL